MYIILIGGIFSKKSARAYSKELLSKSKIPTVTTHESI